MFNMLVNALALEDPSEYEDFYEDLSWKTFRTDDHIYERGYHRDLLVYCRKLQHCYEQLLEELSESYLYDVEGIIEKFNEVNVENCRLAKELAVAHGHIEILEEQLKLARSWQSVSGRKAEIDQGMGRPVDEPKDNTKKNTRNQFTSNSGATKQENMMMAAAYHENQWTPEEIAEELKMAVSSIRSYISTMKKHYEVKLTKEGKYIIFDKEYGNVKWNLALYEKLHIKFPDKEIAV